MVEFWGHQQKFLKKCRKDFLAEKMVRGFPSRKNVDSVIGRMEVKFLQKFERGVLNACRGGILGASTKKLRIFEKVAES